MIRALGSGPIDVKVTGFAGRPSTLRCWMDDIPELQRGVSAGIGVAIGGTAAETLPNSLSPSFPEVALDNAWLCGNQRDHRGAEFAGLSA